MQNFDSLASLEQSLSGTLDSKQRSAWVFSTEEDDLNRSLYPIGLELPIAHGAAPRKPPVRHSSFAGSRYAKVHQRPKRAHSFAQQRDLNIEKILNGSSSRSYPLPLPPLPRPKLIVPPPGQYSNPSKRVMRSNSLQVTKAERAEAEATLSNKFQACSLDEMESSSVLELGSLASRKSSEPSLVDALVDIPSKAICANNCNDYSRPVSRDNNESSENESRARVYSIYSFSSPTLNSIETLEKASSASSESSDCSLPEPDYASPRKLYLNNNQKIYNIGPPEFNPQVDANKDYSSSEYCFQSTFRKKFAPQAPRTFLPRLTPVLTDSNTKSAVGVDFRYQQSGQEPSSSKESYYSTYNSHSQESSHHNPSLNMNEKLTPKFSQMRYQESRLTHFESTPLPVIEENDRLSNEEYSLQNDLKENVEPARPGAVTPIPLVKPAVPTTPKPKVINLTKNGITKPPRYSVLQKKIMNQTKKNETKISNENDKVLNTMFPRENMKPYREIENETNYENIRMREIGVGTMRTASQYEQAHREALGDSDQLLGRIPSGEIKRNKIVLRVPSFRTAGCQTESYKPIRRRASCAQTNLSVAPRNKTNTANGYMTIGVGAGRLANQVNRNSTQETSSSSSGYSSPEVSSKEPSPQHSGPPSPSEKSTLRSDKPRRSKSNVTVIEINKADNTTLISTLAAPPRPPKPIRMRHSAAADLSSHNFALPMQRKPKMNSSINDLFGFSALTENIFTLTEAVNPVIVQPPRHPSVRLPNARSITLSRSKSVGRGTPRIIDMYPKRMGEGDENVSRAEVFAEDGRTSVLPRLRGSLVGHFNSSDSRSPSDSSGEGSGSNRWTDELDWEVGNRWREEREKELINKWSNDTGGRATAAYLASLELLASHYRHQALHNAKVRDQTKKNSVVTSTILRVFFGNYS